MDIIAREPGNRLPYFYAQKERCKMKNMKAMAMTLALVAGLLVVGLAAK